jgi:plastocyanin
MRFASLQLILAASAALFAASARAAVIEFHIKAGTGAASWNSSDELVTARIGDTVRIINDDSVVHALHTDDDVPCAHGSDMQPGGGHYDCVIENAYDPSVDGALIDHWHHAAEFWLLATP